MNDLNITNVIRKVSFTYETAALKFEGNCDVSSDNIVSDVNAQVSLKETGINIGSCSSNGSTSVNIWNTEYKTYIDTVATDFKALQVLLSTEYMETALNI